MVLRGEYGKAAARILEHCVLAREDEPTPIPMIALLLGTREALLDDDPDDYAESVLSPDAMFDPLVRTGWGAMVYEAAYDAPRALLWVLTVHDDGTRTIVRVPADDEAILNGFDERVRMFLEELPPAAELLTREDRGILFDYTKDHLAAIGLIAERIEHD